MFCKCREDNMASNAKSAPRDAQVMAAILKDMGVVEFEPRLINQMLEFTYRYVTDILDDAKVYSQHANKKSLDADDIKLAVQCRTDHSFTNPPSRDMLQEIARQKNSQPLPPIKPYGGPRLLPDRYCLTAPNYRLKSTKKPVTQPRSIQFGLSSQQRISLSSSGKGIVKNLGSTGGQSLTVMPKAGSAGTVSASQVTILSKPTVATAPKPTIRINTGQTAAGIGASGLAQMVTQSATAPSTFSSSLLPSSSVSSSTSIESASLGSAPSGSIISFNPLKRKAEEEDYDV